MAQEMLSGRMPYSLEAEQAVLGSVIIDPEKFSDVADMLMPEDFYVSQNARLYAVMYGMFVKNKVMDFVTLVEEMKASGNFDDVTAKTFAVQLAEFVPTSGNIKTYARIVREKAMLRALIGASGEISQMCSEGVDEFSSILDFSEQKIFNITNGRKTYDFPPMLKLVAETYDTIARMASGKADDLKGIPSGFVELDKMIGGLRRSDMIVIAARPGVGKTALALNIASNAVLHENKKTAVFSLEMSTEQLVMRILSSESLIPSDRLGRGEIRSDEWPRLVEAADILSKCPLRLDDNPAVTIAEVKAKLRREKDVALVIIDYLQLMKSPSKSENRVQEVADITRSLKILAKELSVPVIILSQLSRESDKRSKEPILSDLRESGAIEQDADIVLMLHREGEQGDELSNIVKCKVAKNRHGPVGSVDFVWSGQFTRFGNLEKVYGEA